MIRKIINLSSQILCLLALLVFAQNAHAQLISVTCTDKGTTLSQSQCDTLMSSLETELNSGLPNVETGQYTQGIANANAMAATGVGYAIGSDFSYALIGGGIGLGVDLGDNSLSDVITGKADMQTMAGLGAQGSAVLGINPGKFYSNKIWFIDPTRIRIYLSFMSKSQSFDTISAKFSNFGLVGSYNLLAGTSLGLGMVKWNGVNIVSGIKYATFEGSFSQSIPATSVAGPLTTTASAAAAPALISADSSNFSIPIEANSSVKLLHFLTFNAGLGADLNFGNTSGTGTYDTTILISGAGAGGATGAASAEVGSDSSPTLMNLRAMFGTNIDFVVGSLNLGVQKSLTGGVWGVNAGLNFFW